MIVTEPNEPVDFETSVGDFRVVITDDGELKIYSTSTRRVLAVRPHSDNSVSITTITTKP